MAGGAPSSIIIIGGGAFGLSTLHALLSDARYAGTLITLVDAHIAPPGHGSSSSASYPTASLDSSRIVRPDYADAAYAALAASAHGQWRQGWPTPSAPAYHEPGLILTANRGSGNPRAPAYLAASLANVQQLRRSSEPAAHELADGAAVATALFGSGAPPSPGLGDHGYINPGSGVANAALAVDQLREECARLGAARPVSAALRWVHGSAQRLVFERQSAGWVVRGAVLADASELRADLTVIAAGAWSAALLPRSLGPRLRAQAQALAYVRLNWREADRLRGRPVVLNISTGVFAIMPPAQTAAEPGEEVLKVAQHAFGYHHSERVADTEPDGHGELEVSVPAPASEIPKRSRSTLEEYLADAFPEIDRPFDYTRTCWYTDTGTGDYIIDFVPAYGQSVLVVTGGSGHGFKMLPVLGKWVLKRIEGTLDGELGSLLDKQWRWRSNEQILKDWEAGGDGSRGGEPGLAWDEEV